jgi:uncharacterized membrane protein
MAIALFIGIYALIIMTGVSLCGFGAWPRWLSAVWGVVGVAGFLGAAVALQYLRDDASVF